MALFGNKWPQGGGLVDPLGEEERRRRLEAIMQNRGTPGPAFDPTLGNSVARQFAPALPDFSPQDLQKPTLGTSSAPALPDFQVRGAPNLPAVPASPEPAPQRTLDPDVLKLVGEAPKKKNNTLRDILAFTLAAAGDTVATRNGYRGNALNGVFKAWDDRRDTIKAQKQLYEDRMRIAGLPGMSVREMAAYIGDPKAWSNHMADAATSRYQAATLNPGDTRFLGEGNGSVQAPTRAQQYAQTLGLTPGSAPYNNAIRDQELGANGPTAFGNSQTLENLRARIRGGYEAQRQQNRMAVRSAPTYRDLNPPPMKLSARRMARGNAGLKTSRPTATGPNGEKVEWDGRDWVPVQ